VRAFFARSLEHKKVGQIIREQMEADPQLPLLQRG
jgi:hypothetical protein